MECEKSKADGLTKSVVPELRLLLSRYDPGRNACRKDAGFSVRQRASCSLRRSVQCWSASKFQGNEQAGSSDLGQSLLSDVEAVRIQIALPLVRSETVNDPRFRAVVRGHLHFYSIADR